MALSVAATGTQTAVISTEHTLSSRTDSKIYQLSLDTNNMVDGDIVEIKVKIKVLSGSTLATVYSGVYAHTQGQSVKYSIPVPSTHQVDFTLKQTAGTGRNFDFEVIQLDA